MNRTIGQAILLGVVAAMALRLTPDSDQGGTISGAGSGSQSQEDTAIGNEPSGPLVSIHGKEPERLIAEFYSARVTPDSPGYLELVAAALSRAAGMNPARPGPPTLEEVRSLREATVEQDIALRFLILSVPDPVDSNLGSFSDITFDGLQRAAERRGYLFDRYWLPWTPARDGATGAPGVITRTGDHLPGLILFRCNRNFNEVLAVFVVGETPTTGVDKAALRRSLDFLSFWHDSTPVDVSQSAPPRSPPVAPAALDSRPTLPIFFLGPFFSGAAASVRIVIQEWFESSAPRIGNATVSCISGSASAISNKATLELSPTKQRLGLDITFHATVIPDSIVTEVLLDYLTQHRIGREQVAFLTEADTSFGEQILQVDGASTPAAATDVLQIPFPMHISSMRSAYDKDSRLLTGKRRDIHNAPKSNLDLSLGDIRGTPQRVPSFSPTTISSVERSIAHILLSMTRKGIRCIGIISTDVRDQLFLAEQVHFYCPDVQLVLFRADSIFTHPDAQPALEGALVATTYPLISKNQKWTAFDDETAMRRLSFTNVASEGVYNATLALLALSDPPASTNGSGSPCADGRLPGTQPNGVAFDPLEYRRPFDDPGSSGVTAPPIWLTSISNGEFWPVAVIPSVEWEKREQSLLPRDLAKPARAAKAADKRVDLHDQRYVLRAAVARPPSGDQGSSRAFADPEIDDGLRGMLGLVATVFSGFCLASALRYLLGQPTRGDNTAAEVQSGWWPVAYFVALLMAEIVLTLPALVRLALWFRGRVPFGFQTDNSSRHFVLLAVLFVEHAALWTLCAAIAVGVVLWARREAVRQQPNRVRGFVRRTVERSLLAALLLEIGLLYFAAAPSRPLSTYAIFLERAARFGDRMTPTLPWFFVAVASAWWFRGHLQRQSFAVRFPLLNAFQGAATRSRRLDYAGLTEMVRPVADCLESGRGWPTRDDAEDFTWRALLGHGFASVSRVLAWHTLIVFPILFLVVSWAHSLAAYEPVWFYDLLWFTWFVVVCLFWLTIWQFLWGTYMFLELLRRLARHPMADAFQRLPRKTRQALGWLLLSRLPRRFELEPSLRIWRSLLSSLPALAATTNNKLLKGQLNLLQADVQFKQANKTAKQFADWLNETQSPAQQRSRAAFEKVIAEATAPLLPMLGHLWRERFEARQRRLLERRGAQAKLKIGSAAVVFTPKERRWLSLAERLVVIQMGTLFCQVFWHLRRLLISALLIMVFLLASMNSYNFQPRRMLVAFGWALVTAFVVAAVAALVRLNRNELLSRISGTPPDQITWNFGLVASLGAYALIPILSALSFQFPQVGRLTFFVSDALLHAFR